MAVATAEKKMVKKAAPKAAPKVMEKSIKGTGFAVIETGGKQYGVEVGDTIKIEKLLGEHKEGDTVSFDKILLVEDGTKVDVGTPYITGAKATGIIIEIGRSAKVTVIKYKQKSRYFKKNGHRQPFFQVKIEKIS